MKKANKASPGAPPPPPLFEDDDDDDLLPHYDFASMRRVKPPRRLQEGERIYINDAPFIVRGRGFVPDTASKESDNGKPPRKKKL